MKLPANIGIIVLAVVIVIILLRGFSFKKLFGGSC